MWWPFGRKQEKEKEERTMYLVLPDDPEITIENYRATYSWFIDPDTGAEAHAFYEEPTSFPHDTPWIRESEAKKIQQRFVNARLQKRQRASERIPVS